MNDKKHCCELMDTMIASGEVAIRFVEKFREYGISYIDGGTSYQIIEFCPWCGKKLPASLRQEWFDALEEMGLEPGDKNIPEKFLTSDWYRT
jgi:hypothetical protein